MTRGHVAPGFYSLCRRHGVAVVLPDGTDVAGPVGQSPSGPGAGAGAPAPPAWPRPTQSGPAGPVVLGLFDIETKAERIAKFESRHLAGTPSVVLEARLPINSVLTVGGRTYTVRDIETDPDGALTRHFLKEHDQ